MILTTSQKGNSKQVEKAEKLAHELGIPYVPRRERSLDRIYEEEQVDEVMVILKDVIKWYIKGTESSFFFHPGLSVVRIKRLLRGDNDIMVQACQLQPGDSFLDCTLGLAADAIVASFVVGEEGKVLGVESEPMVAFLVKQGLKNVQQFSEIDEAAKRIQVVNEDHLHFLSSIPDKAIDVVYFDPMFRRGIEESSSLQRLRRFANPTPLTIAVIEQAKRIASKRVVLKERKDSGEFNRLGFSVVIRENSGVAYGILEV